MRNPNQCEARIGGISYRMMFAMVVFSVAVTWFAAQLYNQHQKQVSYKACIETTTNTESLLSCVARVFQGRV